MPSQDIVIHTPTFTIEDFLSLEALLQTFAITLEHPESQTISAVSLAAGYEGDPFVVTREWIATNLQERSNISLQWWINTVDYVYFGVTFAALGITFRFNMDLLEAQRDAFANGFIAYFLRTCTVHPTATLLLDTHGSVDADDWRTILQHDTPVAITPLDVICIPTRVFSRVQLWYPHAQVAYHAHLLIVRPTLPFDLHLPPVETN